MSNFPNVSGKDSTLEFIINNYHLQSDTIVNLWEQTDTQKKQFQDSIKAQIFMYLGLNRNGLKDFESSKKYFKKSIEILESYNDSRYLPYLYSYLAGVYNEQREYENAKLYYFKSLSRSQNKDLTVANYINLALVNSGLKKKDSSYYYYLKAQDNVEYLEDNSYVYQRFYRALFNYYRELEEYDESIDILKKVLLNPALSKDTNLIVNIFIDISNTNSRLGNFEKKKLYLDSAIYLSRVSNNYSSLVISYLNTDLKVKNNRDSILKYLKKLNSKPLKIYYYSKLISQYYADGEHEKVIRSGEEYINEFQGYELENKKDEISLIYYFISESFRVKGDNTKSKYYLNKVSSKSNLSTDHQILYYKRLAKSSKDEGDYANSLKFHLISDSLEKLIYNEKNIIARAKLDYQLNAVEQERKIEQLSHENEIQKAETEKEKFYKRAIIAALVIIFFFLIWLAKQYRNQNRANVELEEKNKKIDQQREELGYINEELSEKNEQLFSSMRYAERIQLSLIPNISKLTSKFPNSFLLYQPRDIVSGDFYWFGENSEYFYVVVADCTGHGIPGSLLTMMGVMALNEAVEHVGIKNPEQILAYVDETIIENLKKDNDTVVNDGMDAAILAFSKSDSMVTFSGANRPLITIKDDKLEYVKGDRLSIGGTAIFEKDEYKKFTAQEINIKTIDSLFIYSDGYQDQMNNSNRKIGRKRLKELLINSHKHKNPIHFLKDQFDQHRGGRSQIDDVTVLGINFK